MITKENVGCKSEGVINPIKSEHVNSPLRVLSLSITKMSKGLKDLKLKCRVYNPGKVKNCNTNIWKVSTLSIVIKKPDKYYKNGKYYEIQKPK